MADQPLIVLQSQVLAASFLNLEHAEVRDVIMLDNNLIRTRDSMEVSTVLDLATIFFQKPFTDFV